MVRKKRSWSRLLVGPVFDIRRCLAVFTVTSTLLFEQGKLADDTWCWTPLGCRKFWLHLAINSGPPSVNISEMSNVSNERRWLLWMPETFPQAWGAMRICSVSWEKAQRVPSMRPNHLLISVALLGEGRALVMSRSFGNGSIVLWDTLNPVKSIHFLLVYNGMDTFHCGGSLRVRV